MRPSRGSGADGAAGPTARPARPGWPDRSDRETGATAGPPAVSRDAPAAVPRPPEGTASIAAHGVPEERAGGWPAHA